MIWRLVPLAALAGCTAYAEPIDPASVRCIVAFTYIVHLTEGSELAADPAAVEAKVRLMYEIEKASKQHSRAALEAETVEAAKAIGTDDAAIRDDFITCIAQQEADDEYARARGSLIEAMKKAGKLPSNWSG